MPGPDELAFELEAVSKRLKEAGEGGLARELSRRTGQAVAQLPQQIREGLKPHLPDRYADVLDADLDLRRSTRTTADGMRITVSATTRSGRRRLTRLDDGTLWHPTFGSRRRGRYQEVAPGWFSGPAEDAIPQVREAIAQALDDVVRKAVGE